MADLGFGLMRLPLRDPDDQTSIDTDLLKRMVDEFLAAGFDYFDTAYYYHRNTSEAAIREALVERHPRGSFRLATKMPMKLLESREHQESIFSEQLENCGVEYFDCYLLHNICRSYYPTAERLDTFRFLRERKEEGRIRRLGFSIHDDADFLERVLERHAEDTEVVQLQVNYLDWDSPETQAGRCCEVCESYGIPVIVMEPVKGGALANVPAEVAEMFGEAAPGMSPASWAMRFAGGIGCVETVLSGMTDMDQMRDNIRTMRDLRPLDDHELEVLDVSGRDVLFRVHCDAGTYVRTLCHDLGKRIGCGARMTALRRISSDKFNVAEAVTLDELSQMSPSTIKKILIPVRSAVPSLAF